MSTKIDAQDWWHRGQILVDLVQGTGQIIFNINNLLHADFFLLQTVSLNFQTSEKWSSLQKAESLKTKGHDLMHDNHDVEERPPTTLHHESHLCPEPYLNLQSYQPENELTSALGNQEKGLTCYLSQRSGSKDGIYFIFSTVRFQKAPF